MHSNVHVVPLNWTSIQPTKPQGLKPHCSLKHVATAKHLKQYTAKSGTWKQLLKLDSLNKNKTKEQNSIITGQKNTAHKFLEKTNNKKKVALLSPQASKSHYFLYSRAHIRAKTEASLTPYCHTATQNRQALLSPFSRLEPDGDATSSSLHLDIVQFPGATTQLPLRCRDATTDQTMQTILSHSPQTYLYSEELRSTATTI